MKTRAQEILRRLKKAYPVLGPFVHSSNPLELLVGTVLAAQCTDIRVNEVTKFLFKKYRSAQDYADADLTALEREIYSTGFYKSKARYLKGIGQMLVKKYRGKVPDRLEDLLTLPGVAKKTAYLVLGKGFGKIIGIPVDTHVARLSPRLGLTKEKIPEKIGMDLQKLFPRRDYLEVNTYFIMHGRKICVRKPKCPDCVVNDICLYYSSSSKQSAIR